MNPLRLLLLSTLFFGIIIAPAQNFRVIKETNDYILKECDSAFYYAHENSPSKLLSAYCRNYEDDLGEIIVMEMKTNKVFKIKIGSYSLSNLRWLTDNSFAYYRVYWGTSKHKYLGLQYFTVEIKK